MKRFSLYPIVLAFVFSSLALAAPPTFEEVEAVYQKMSSNVTDSIDIGKHLVGFECELQINLIAHAQGWLAKVEHVQDMLRIDSIVQNEADRERIRPLISRRLKFMAENVDGTITSANLITANAKSLAVVASANTLKENLRSLKALLLKF